MEIKNSEGMCKVTKKQIDFAIWLYNRYGLCPDDCFLRTLQLILLAGI